MGASGSTLTPSDVLSPSGVAALGRATDALRARGLAPTDPEATAYPDGGMPGYESHFTMGVDKRGYLWTLHGAAAVSAGLNLVVVGELTFHKASMNATNPATGRKIVHGGASAAVIDMWAAIVGNRVLETMLAVTATQDFVYRRPIVVDQRVVVVGEARAADVEPGKSAVVRCALLTEDPDTPLVTASTLMKIPRALQSSSTAAAMVVSGASAGAPTAVTMAARGRAAATGHAGSRADLRVGSGLRLPPRDGRNQRPPRSRL